MMSEKKRFEWIDKDTISDNQTDEWYCLIFDDIRDDFIDLLNELNDENERLRQQLLYDCDDVCGICGHRYLVSSGDYFISKCKKGHEECSKEDIKYCEDFELRGVYDDCQIR